MESDGLAAVRLVDETDIGMFKGKDLLGYRVGGAVVDDDDFDRGWVIGFEDREKCGTDNFFFVIGSDEDGDRG